MIRVKQMYTTMSDSRDEEFAVSAGWLNLFLRRNNFTCRRDAREFTEKLAKFVTFPSQIFERNELNSWSQINAWSVK